MSFAEFPVDPVKFNPVAFCKAAKFCKPEILKSQPCKSISMA
jgi:hypothetical protein